MNFFQRHFMKPTALALASSQLGDAELKLLEDQMSLEAWQAEVDKGKKRVARLKQVVIDLSPKDNQAPSQ